MAGGLINWSTIITLLLGATISAIVSYVLQRNAFAEARKQKQLDKIEERKALGLNILTKMIRIASTLELLRQSLDAAFERAKADGVKPDPWAIVKPVANLPGRVHFDPKELTSLLAIDMDLFNDIGPFDDLHNNTLDLFEMYRAERNAFTSTLPADMNGDLGSTDFTSDQTRRNAPKIAQLNSIIAGMVQRTTEDSKEAWELLAKLQAALNEEFGLGTQDGAEAATGSAYASVGMLSLAIIIRSAHADATQREDVLFNIAGARRASPQRRSRGPARARCSKL